MRPITDEEHKIEQAYQEGKRNAPNVECIHCHHKMKISTECLCSDCLIRAFCTYCHKFGVREWKTG